jgi:hypothetical protein
MDGSGALPHRCRPGWVSCYYFPFLPLPFLPFLSFLPFFAMWIHPAPRTPVGQRSVDPDASTYH